LFDAQVGEGHGKPAGAVLQLAEGQLADRAVGFDDREGDRVGGVSIAEEFGSVVVHRDGAVGGDVDFLAILHGVEEVAAELVDGDDLGVVPDVSEDDARC
jgi:hypothetical protein